MKQGRIDASAQVRWRFEHEKSNRKLISGQVYGANLRFENDDTLWSVAIQLNKPPDSDQNQIVDLGFLFRENLEDKLAIGRLIYIFEGPEKLVAEGKIISVNKL